MRYAESLSKTHLGVRIPRSTLHCWEVRRGDVVREVLKAPPKASDPHGLRLLGGRLDEVY